MSSSSDTTRRSCMCKILRDQNAPPNVDITRDDVYRCFDCQAFVCKPCLKDHMGGHHRPHPITEVQLLETIAGLQSSLTAITAERDEALTALKTNPETIRETGIIWARPTAEVFAKLWNENIRHASSLASALAKVQAMEGNQRTPGTVEVCKKADVRTGCAEHCFQCGPQPCELIDCPIRIAQQGSAT